MNLRWLRPTPLVLLVFLFLLVVVAVVLGSGSATYSLSGDQPAESRFTYGLGAVTVTTVGKTRSVSIGWVSLMLDLLSCYLAAALLSRLMVAMTDFRRPALAFGLVSLLVLAGTLGAAAGASKFYWGYFFFRPAPLSEFGEVEKVTAVIPLWTETNEDGSRRIVLEEDFTIRDALNHGRERPYYNLMERGLFVLERRGLLPERHSTDLGSLPPLFPLIRETGILAVADEGYDDADLLEGILVDGVGGEGQRLVLVGLKGQQVSNDHRPLYELAFSAPAGSMDLTYIRGQRFFYDVAGIEGMEWYVIWPILALPGLVLGVSIFTVVVFVRTRRRRRALRESPATVADMK